MGLPSVDMSERRGCSRDESTGKCEVWRAVLSGCVGMAPAAHQSQLSRSNSKNSLILPLLQTGFNGSRRQRISVAAGAAARPARASRTLAAVRLAVRLTVTTGTPRARLPSGFPAWWPSTIIDGAPPARSRGPPAGHRGCGGRVRAGHGRAAQPRGRAARHRL
eukprot:COSAG06_NODE_4202_length_4481_cov_3.937015_3_plen_163_part_00